jgi:hypothetical protein
MLEAYCMAALCDHRHLKRMVGTAVDGRSICNQNFGYSEDLMAIEITNWTPDLEQNVAERRALLDILVPERLKRRSRTTQEYPAQHVLGQNRQQRRAAERRATKDSRKPSR